MIILPFFLPRSSSEQPKCETCKVPLDTIEVCAACKTEIPKEKITPIDIVMCIGLLLVISTVGFVVFGLWVKFILSPILDFFLL